MYDDVLLTVIYQLIPFRLFTEQSVVTTLQAVPFLLKNHCAFQRLTYLGQCMYTNKRIILGVCDLKGDQTKSSTRNILQNTLNFMYVATACKKKRRRRTRICLISTANTFRLVSFLSGKHKRLISSD